MDVSGIRSFFHSECRFRRRPTAPRGRSPPLAGEDPSLMGLAEALRGFGLAVTSSDQDEAMRKSLVMLKDCPENIPETETNSKRP